MSAPPAVDDLANVGAPTPKDLPASLMPTPAEAQATQPSSSCAAAAQPPQDVQMARQAALKEMQQTFQGPRTAQGVPMANVRESYGQKPRIQYIRSPRDIDWDFPIQDPKDDLRALRNRVPKMNEKQFKDIFPEEDQSTICVVQKNYSRHYVHLQEATTWIIKAIHWFNTFQQPMMIVIRCRDWEDASKFQYLMQILQVTLEDYIPNWQIFVERPETVDKSIIQWQMCNGL